MHVNLMLTFKIYIYPMYYKYIFFFYHFFILFILQNNFFNDKINFVVKKEALKNLIYVLFNI